MTDSTFVFGVDLDGVCADYTAGFAEVVAELKGCRVEDLPAERGWDFAEWDLDAVGGFEHVHRTAVLERGMFRTMPMLPGCAEALWRLSDAGVWIRIITHRLVVHWGHQAAVADTVAWLDDNGIPYRDLCFLGRKPEVEADCYVDDAPHNVESLRAHGNYALVYDAPYNRDIDGPRVHDWVEVQEAVLARMAEVGIPVQAPLPVVGDDPDRLRRRTV